MGQLASACTQRVIRLSDFSPFVLPFPSRSVPRPLRCVCAECSSYAHGSFTHIGAARYNVIFSFLAAPTNVLELSTHVLLYYLICRSVQRAGGKAAHLYYRSHPPLPPLLPSG